MTLKDIKQLYDFKVGAKVKQYGILYVLRQSFFILIRAIYRTDSYVILSTDTKTTAITPDINIIKLTSLKQFKNLLVYNQLVWDIKRNVIEAMLKRDEIVFIVIDNNMICAYAGIQLEGKYKFGINTMMDIPNGFIMFKNLYVSIDYRGKALGKYLNIVRINDSHDERRKIVFVQKENIIAIKNWYKLGFKEIVSIRQTTLFKKFTTNHFSFTNSADNYKDLERVLNEL
ncbi:hypothetical protein TSL6_10410 [Sulfurovum sp. TSL6]|uniref:GNAT family N-acetyltransferase n=1 Tax=Sulfurovum sp. TSL6 TaxID=2826995 RepID=UPI001CC390A8|nr:hypothetical protein [Sulfurovum sp. TSL6]GIU00535.1 hypothetical protein TSL6_10410 [Sulfurovum sp. TSL6]